MNPRQSGQFRTAFILLTAAIGVVAAIFGSLTTLRAHAQSAQTAGEGAPSFEVASIKLCRDRKNLA